jgi:hypothetical protein
LRITNNARVSRGSRASSSEEWDGCVVQGSKEGGGDISAVVRIEEDIVVSSESWGEGPVGIRSGFRVNRASGGTGIREGDPVIGDLGVLLSLGRVGMDGEESFISRRAGGDDDIVESRSQPEQISKVGSTGVRVIDESSDVGARVGRVESSRVDLELSIRDHAGFEESSDVPERGNGGIDGELLISRCRSSRSASSSNQSGDVGCSGRCISSQTSSVGSGGTSIPIEVGSLR